MIGSVVICGTAVIILREADGMSDVIRIFAEKREGFNVVAQQTLWDIRHNLGLRAVTDLRFLVRYDIEGLTREE